MVCKPTTGNWDIHTNLHVFGELKFGDSFVGTHHGTLSQIPDLSTNVGFAKSNKMNQTDYALAQFDSGDVHLNAPAGAKLSFRKDGVEKGYINANGEWVILSNLACSNISSTGLLISNGVTTTNVIASGNLSVLGAAGITNAGPLTNAGDLTVSGDATFSGTLQVPGNNATTTGSFGELTGKSNNYCAFAVTNNFNQTDYALAQMTGGTTQINCKAGKMIMFSQGGPQTNQVMVCGASGNWNIKNDLIVDGSLTVNGQGVGSDDRLKIDEQPILNALNAIRQVQPQTYIKLKNESETDGFPSSGVIAQQLNEIADLRYCVNVPETDTSTDEDDAGEPVTKTNYWSVNYNGLFTHLLAAVKELDLVVQQQTIQIQQLQSQVNN